MRNDPDVAERVAAMPEGAMRQWRPRAEDFTLQHQLLARIVNQNDAIIARLTDLKVQERLKRRTKPGPPFPTPPSEIEAARARARRRQHETVIARVAEAQARWAAMEEAGGEPDPPPGGPGKREVIFE